MRALQVLAWQVCTYAGPLGDDVLLESPSSRTWQCRSVSAGVAGTLRCALAAGRAVHPRSRERQRDEASAAEPAAGACRQAGSPAPCWGLQDMPLLLHDSWVAQRPQSKMLLELADK